MWSRRCSQPPNGPLPAPDLGLGLDLAWPCRTQLLDEYFGSDEALDDGDRFLKEYILNKV
jgi:hypothetical protein